MRITLDPIATLKKIHAQGLATANDSIQVIEPEYGQAIAQGDLNIFWLGDRLPESAVSAARDRQLAPGTTRGSRHCIKADDLANVEFYRLPKGSPLHGPVLRFLTPVTIEHPEHGDQLWPAGVVAITYQLLHAAEIKRNAD